MRDILFCTHRQCANSLIEIFLLISSSDRSAPLLSFEHGQGQKSEKKHTTKNFVLLHNHSPTLTMGCFNLNDRR